jgi:hypothetical protein
MLSSFICREEERLDPLTTSMSIRGREWRKLVPEVRHHSSQSGIEGMNPWEASCLPRLAVCMLLNNIEGSRSRE